jgi:hypothetical protein
MQYEVLTGRNTDPSPEADIPCIYYVDADDDLTAVFRAALQAYEEDRIPDRIVLAVRREDGTVLPGPPSVIRRGRRNPWQWFSWVRHRKNLPWWLDWLPGWRAP